MLLLLRALEQAVDDARARDAVGIDDVRPVRNLVHAALVLLLRCGAYSEEDEGSEGSEGSEKDGEGRQSTSCVSQGPPHLDAVTRAHGPRPDQHPPPGTARRDEPMSANLRSSKMRKLCSLAILLSSAVTAGVKSSRMSM